MYEKGIGHIEERKTGRDDWAKKKYGISDFSIARKKCKERDKYTCQFCGCHNNLTVHHIDGQAYKPELRSELSNLITLCEPCHVSYHHDYLKGELSTKERFAQWMKFRPYNNNEEELERERKIAEMNKKLFGSENVNSNKTEMSRRQLMQACLNIAIVHGGNLKVNML